jgi:hypothetical protein
MTREQKTKAWQIATIIIAAAVTLVITSATGRSYQVRENKEVNSVQESRIHQLETSVEYINRNMVTKEDLSQAKEDIKELIRQIR